MNQIRERCHLIYRNEAKSLAVFVSEKSTEFTYHRCRQDTEKQRPSASEKHKAATKLCRVALVGTKEGGDWLRLLVFAVIYCFGIKGGIGSESLSFFSAVASRRANRVFCQCLERTGSTAQRTNHRLWTSPSRGKSWRATDRHLGRW